MTNPKLFPQLVSHLRLVLAVASDNCTYCGIADFPSANKDVYTHLGVSFFLSLL